MDSPVLPGDMLVVCIRSGLVRVAQNALTGEKIKALMDALPGVDCYGRACPGCAHREVEAQPCRYRLLIDPLYMAKRVTLKALAEAGSVKLAMTTGEQQYRRMAFELARRCVKLVEPGVAPTPAAADAACCFCGLPFGEHPPAPEDVLGVYILCSGQRVRLWG